MNINHLNTIPDDLACGEEAAFHVHYWGSIADHHAHSLHKHSFFECCYVTHGEGYYHENGAHYPLHEGDIFLSRPDTWHQIESPSGIGLAWVAFLMKEEGASPDMLRKYRQLADTDRILVSSATPSLTASLWQALWNAESAEVYNRPLLVPIAYSLILSFFQTFLEDTERKPALSKPQESILLHKARLFIHDNLSLRIKFKDLAEYSHISERHLSRLFKEELGISFSDYYRKVKIQKATALLESTDYTLEQISAATGFYSVHHFAKTFKQTTGTSPGQWRKTSLIPPKRQG
ncbi:AraC family transcriptional regulator [Cohnella nanjingensis]|uniref:AraC family transcriptional regulator n=1 Tax=Cohnella nanjingensis TaxID=1387779 RepID=A0A7X0RR91_9BACL|nr:AraC family transcriptional regulator [Cohnella nanjingensis]MBB6672198.1 AraC family transcriptional regulator [Cohnella nanjingensis]